MSWELFCAGYASPKTFLEDLYLWDLWTRRNGGVIR